MFSGNVNLCANLNKEFKPKSTMIPFIWWKKAAI